VRFKLTGGDEAIRNVANVRAVMSDHNMQGDGLDAVQPIVDDAKSLAPVDQGNLRDSIGAEVDKDGFISVVIRDWKGHFFEFGTVKMRAQPMLIPAFDANEATVTAIFASSIRKRIEGAV